MKRNVNYKIALILYTPGLDYDDRIRKEILSIQELYPNVSFKIFAVDPRNREEEGFTSYGVPYRIPFLKTREKFTQATHVLEKGLDFYLTIKSELKDYDAIWCADIETILFTLFTIRKPILWDLHELPEGLLVSWWKRLVFRFAEWKVKVMVHANEQRLNYLVRKGCVKRKEKHFILRNYPQFDDTNYELDKKYLDFEKWLGHDKCVYIQGITTRGRADAESVEAVLNVPSLKAVVIGNTRKDLVTDLLKKHSKEEINKKLYFTGQIAQQKTPQYMRKCCMSLVFYKKTSMNNWFCEPNRLFQNLIYGNPVVVGNNPPMKEIVDNYHVGVSIDSDGSDSEAIKDAILNILNNYQNYRQEIDRSKKKWLWYTQEDVLKVIMKDLLA